MKEYLLIECFSMSLNFLTPLSSHNNGLDRPALPCPFSLKKVTSRVIFISLLVAMIWLSLSVYAEAQDTPATAASKQIPNPVPQIQEKQVGTDFSEAEERKAWVLFLRKLTAEEKKTSFDWQSLAATVTGGLITALVTIFALWFNAKREAAREKSRMNHEAVLKFVGTKIWTSLTS